ncbi:MAG: DUF1553 domain-containing protein [Pirellulales bacterium]
MRLICNSRTYQLSVAANDWNQDDSINYSHAKARRLPAEVLYDAVHRVTGAVSRIPGVEPGTRAAALADVTVSLPDGFLNNLGRPVRESACECERSHDLQLGPVMALVSGPTVGSAISDPQCELPQIAKKELNDEELVQEIYLRVLNRPATKAETDMILSTAGQIDVDHDTLQKKLAEREAWWKEEHKRLEDKRLAALADAEKAVAARTQEMAPERERLTKEREARIAAAKTELETYGKNSIPTANKYLKEKADDRTWYTVDVQSAAASNKATLTRQPDRSIKVSGEKGKGVYTLTFRTPLKNIRGIRLEALTDPELPNRGPGLPPNGNFVLTEFEIKAAPASDPKAAQEVKLTNAKADFTQAGFNPAAAIDGQNRDQGGWAIHDQGGLTHWITFQAEQPIGFDGGTIITVMLHQFHNAEDHRLGRFRLAVSIDDGEVGLGLSEEFAALRSIPEAKRTAENLTALVGYLQSNEEGWKNLKAKLAEAEKPIPADDKLNELNQVVAELNVATTDDRLLVQLRKDVEASTAQVQQRRLTLAQDLTWALINSPAFLFNR